MTISPVRLRYAALPPAGLPGRDPHVRVRGTWSGSSGTVRSLIVAPFCYERDARRPAPVCAAGRIVIIAPS
jgi:hypothetical protein